MLLVLLLVGAEAKAAEMEFMGEAITPMLGQFLVEKDVNVRAKPKTRAKRLGGLKAGELVDVVGHAGKTAWLAVAKDGKPIGFVYGTVLSPVIDGEIKDDVTGELTVGDGHRCGFRIHFIGKQAGENAGIRTSDYDVGIVCERAGVRTRFPAQMFMTEVPFDGSSKRQVFQINIDLLDNVHALQDIFSTILMFDLDKGEVRLDSMSEKSYRREEGGLKSLPATSVARALHSCMEIAFSSWSDKAWQDIFDNTR